MFGLDAIGSKTWSMGTLNFDMIEYLDVCWMSVWK